MRILISNDDGIDAPGIHALAAAASEFGDIIIAAPDSAQSGAGHGITVHHPLTVRDYDFRLPTGKAVEAYSIDGRPADCVRLAIKALLTEPVDLVLSGINRGANDGICVFYSGTVAAAAEARILGVPAMAFSAKVAHGQVDYVQAQAWCRTVLAEVLATPISPEMFLNVNFPNLCRPEWPLGVTWARQSRAELLDHYEALQTNAAGERVFQLGGDYALGEDGADSDSIHLAHGYVTITPLRIDMTDRAMLEARSNH
jgi:5'-nucleotidase